MIVKSMSRKVPSFGQLIGYIDRDEGQEQWRIRHNVMARDPARILAEFERNGGLLAKRKNGVYLYHEIISITRAAGLSEAQQKERLQEIAEQYIAACCPDNLVYGGLHQDKDHSFHYHLMISANRAGERGRLRLTKAQFRKVQVELERHVLQAYPELEQKVAIDKRAEHRKSRGEAELERRTGKVPKKQQVLDRLQAAFGASDDRQSLMEALGREGLELYIRGQNLGVVDLESGKKHRLKTLDLEMADRVAARMSAALEVEQKPEPETQAARPEGRDAKPETARKVEESAPEAKSASEGEKEKRRATARDGIDQPQRAKRKEAERMQPVEPGKTRRELIDKGHVEPDPARDKLSHEEWKRQDSFFAKVGQSMRRTFDDLTGRTEQLSEKAKGNEQVVPDPSPQAPSQKAEAERKAEAQQAKWREEMARQRSKSRDGSERGRE